VYFSPFPCYLVFLRPKCSPEHPILKHLQPTFVPQRERPSFIPIQINKTFYWLKKTHSRFITVRRLARGVTPFFYQSAGRKISPHHIFIYRIRESLNYTAALLRYFATQSNQIKSRRCSLKVEFAMSICPCALLGTKQ